VGGPRLKSPRSDLIIPGIDGYVQRLQREDNQDLMAALSLIYKKPSASNKIFLMKKLFNLKRHRKRRWASQWIQPADEPVGICCGIKFDDEIRALVLMSSLPETWDGLVMAVSNSCGIETLKF